MAVSGLGEGRTRILAAVLGYVLTLWVGDDGGSSGLSSAPAGSDTQNGGRNSRIMMFGDVPVDLEATPNNPLFFTSSFNCNESPGKRRAAQERDMGADSQGSPEHCEVRAAPEVVRKKELASYDSDTHRRSDGVVNFIKKKTQVDLRNQETPRSDGSIQVEKLHTSTGLKDTTSLSASHFVNKRKPFDICLPRRRQLDFAETFDHIEDCEQTYEAVQLVEQENRLLRPGMVLLKNYITLREQIISHSMKLQESGERLVLVQGSFTNRSTRMEQSSVCR
ncbi:uncharacterized protein LOC104427325 isoform X3 [Eucalyptus grandis]|uniref:uncharacterized protein LOC104427325 isoform X3 n=1 Tax=Eucalyptus grandis TaxID=71139 RepID=UPI00192EC0B1|nr:uncharacterized protein LOC104427325 isoform X3 [Eucalyptus grandis]